MNARPETPHPSWYDPALDYDSPQFFFACRIGAGAAAASSADWRDLEPMVASLWLVVSGGLTWEEARPAVYHGWCMARRASSPPG
ncbi:MAG TPA: hypothetical protein VM576_04405 [Xanthomonadaceae bacterium]|jgi:hypothetical protein|nr:hypothetical protein [Xanthomonadaceae bacterium]